MPTVFVDLDGVLVDFVTGACELHGSTLCLEMHLVRWGFPEQIGFSGVNDPKFWAPMGHDFWARLGWTPEGKELLAGIEAPVGIGNVALMTSPCETPGSVEGKVTWVLNNLPAYRRQLFVGSSKHLAAGPDKILVDDHDLNVDKFRQYGGAAIQPPRPWNRRHAEADAMGRFNVAGVLMDLHELLK